MKVVPIASTTPPWGLPPEKIILGSNEVHVWRASLDESPPQIDIFLHTLAADEQTRAERFYFQRDRERFITAHGVLRAILGLYLNMSTEMSILLLQFSWKARLGLGIWRGCDPL